MDARGWSHSPVLFGYPSVDRTPHCTTYMIPEAEGTNIYICTSWCCLVYDANAVSTYTFPGARRLHRAAIDESTLMNCNWGSRHRRVTAEGVAQRWSNPHSASNFPLGEEKNHEAGLRKYSSFAELGPSFRVHAYRRSTKTGLKQTKASTAHALRWCVTGACYQQPG